MIKKKYSEGAYGDKYYGYSIGPFYIWLSNSQNSTLKKVGWRLNCMGVGRFSITSFLHNLKMRLK